MKQNKHIHWIAVDWGTTNLRVWAFSNKPRKASVLRYMPSSSLFDRSLPDRVSANGFKYEFQNRPIYLVSGEAKKNELKN